MKRERLLLPSLICLAILLILALCIGCHKPPVVNPPDPPVIVDPVDPPVEPPVIPVEYVTKDICAKTGLIARDTCEAIGCVVKERFVSGEEPTDKCDVHQHWSYKAPIKELHIGGYFYLWQLRIGWEDEDRVDALEQLFFTLRQIRKARYHVVEGFTWLDSGLAEHSHLNGKTPWARKNGKWDLTKKDARYWDQAEDILRVFKTFKGKLHFQPTLFMRDVYNWRPIKNNVNGVTNLKSDGMIKHAERLALWWLNVFRKVNGNSYDPYFKIANEWMHSSAAEFRQNGYFHWRVAKKLMDKGVPLSHFNVDVSHSEGTQIFLNEPYPHPKLGGEVIGYSKADRSDPSKSILAETHGLALIDNLLPPSEKLHWLNAAWQRYKLSGDGGSWSPENPQYAHGYNPPGTMFYFPTVDELTDCLTFYWAQCKSRGKRGYYCHWTGECFRDENLHWSLWLENCAEGIIDWSLANVPAEVWEKIY